MFGETHGICGMDPDATIELVSGHREALESKKAVNNRSVLGVSYPMTQRIACR